MNNLNNMDRRSIAYVNIFLLSNKIQTALDNGLGDLTAKQWLMLAVLSIFDQAPNLKTLAGACGITHQSAKQLALKLENKGYVLIGKDEEDKRALRIVPTEKYRIWYEEHDARNKRFIEELFVPLTNEEIGIFLKVQSTLQKNIEILVNERFDEFIMD